MPHDPSPVQRWKTEVTGYRKNSSLLHQTTINAIPPALVLVVGCRNFLMSGTYPTYSHVEMTIFVDNHIASPHQQSIN